MEIKVRAWHHKNKEFTYSTLSEIWENGFRVCESSRINFFPCHYDKSGHFLHDSVFRGFKKSCWIPSHAEWELFTGIQDKNGKEVYAGDVLRRHSHEDCFVVEWNVMNARFVLTRICEIPEIGQAIGFLSVCEIIGNIHENPELIGG
jgi:hypothetical protein